MAEQAPTVEQRLESYLAAEEGEVQQNEEVKPETTEPEQRGEEDGLQAEAEKSPEPEKEEVEEVAISNFQELADHLQISPEELYSLEVNVTAADGTPKQVALGEWKDSYQASELLKSEREKIGQERAVFEQETNQRKQAMDAAFFTASKVLEDAEKALLGDINDPKLRELRDSDPGEYSAVLADQQTRMTALQQRKQSLAQEYQQVMEKQAQEMQVQQAQHVQDAIKSLPKFIPEWADEKVASQETSQMIRYGMGEGYTEQELSSLVDPRVVRTLRKAMLYDAQQRAKPEVKKKVVSIGKKVIGGGKSKSKTERKEDERSQDYQNWRKNKAGGSDELRGLASLIDKHLLGED